MNRETAEARALEPCDELLEYAQELAEEERAAVAGVLHDELGGVLVSAKMMLAALEKKLGLGSNAPPEVAKLRGALEGAIAIKHRLEERLHPGLLVHIGLFAALRAQADELISRSGCSCDVQLPAAELPLNSRARIVLYRAAQSAVAHLRGLPTVNALRIAGSASAEFLEVRISAPGISGAKAALSLDRGLQMLQRRMEYLGGTLSVALDNAGTPAVILRLPLRSQLEEPG